MPAVKIGVIADTHLKGPHPGLNRAVDHYFSDADLVLHAGDVIAPEVLHVFGDMPLHVVSGNWDGKKGQSNFPEKKLLEVKGFKIGLIHGWGPPFGLDKRVASQFRGVDCIVFGHSHWTMNSMKDGVLYFNPGTFRGDLFSLWRKTIGILWVDDQIRGEIIRL